MASLLSATDLSQLRALVSSALPDTATVLRTTQSVDVTGGITNSWAAVGTAACYLRVATTRDAQEFGHEAHLLAAQHWRFVLAAGTDITLKDRLTVGAHTYEVCGVGAGQSLWEAAVRALAVEVR